MKLVMTFPDTGVPPEVKTEGEDVERMDIQASFTTPTGRATLLHGRIMSATGRVLSRFSLEVAGKTGEVRIRRPRLDITPAADKPMEKPAESSGKD